MAQLVKANRAENIPVLKQRESCSIVQLELRMSKRDWLRQNPIQNKTDVSNLENILKDPPLTVLVFSIYIVLGTMKLFPKTFRLHQRPPSILFVYFNRMDVK